MTVIPADGTTSGYAAVAYGTAWTSTTPAYKRVDKSPVQCVSGFTVRRGRSYMLDTMDAGTASVAFVDTDGLLDPTNSTGPFYPMNPNCPVVVRLWNPTTDTWQPVFTGLTQSCPQMLNLRANVSTGSIECKDLFSLLANAEIPPGNNYTGTTPTGASNAVGDTSFDAQHIDDHIRALLALAGVPSGLTTIFSGNVANLPMTYPAGTKILSALQDAADAEFPGVAVHYVSKAGLYTFHGRYARFDPTSYSAHTWNVGDRTYVNGGTGRIPVETLTLDRDVEKVINAALYTPQGASASAIAGNLVTNSGSITTYGLRGETGQDLYTGAGITDGLSSLDECQRFGQYLVDNFHDAQTHATQVTFRTPLPSASWASDTWNLLCNVEIGDVMNITTTHPGGGGLLTVPHFVEGLSYDVKIGPHNAGDAEATADVTLTVDLSPQAYFTTAPSGWT